MIKILTETFWHFIEKYCYTNGNNRILVKLCARGCQVETREAQKRAGHFPSEAQTTTSRHCEKAPQVTVAVHGCLVLPSNKCLGEPAAWHRLLNLEETKKITYGLDHKSSSLTIKLRYHVKYFLAVICEVHPRLSSAAAAAAAAGCSTRYGHKQTRSTCPAHRGGTSGCSPRTSSGSPSAPASGASPAAACARRCARPCGSPTAQLC
jgi:hypothetical protein